MERPLQIPLDVRRLARLGTTMGALAFVFAGCTLDELEAVDAGRPMDGAADTDASGPLTGFTEGRESPGTCYDGDDNDDDGDADCDDVMCGGADPVCCVGSSAMGCCAPGPTITVDVSDGRCDGLAASACTELGAGLSFFGDAEPAIEDGGLVPQGGTGHGGVALGGALDPRALALSLDATLVVPDARCADCVDVAGIALVEELPAPGQPARIRVGVLASGSRDEVIVVIDDEPVQRLTLPTGELSLEIRLDVDGTGEIVAGTDVVPMTGIELPPRLFAVVLGRTDNHGPGEAAIAVRQAILGRQTCDVPDALDRFGQVLPASVSRWRPSSLGRPSAAVAGDGRVWVAFEHEGEIRMAGANEDGELLGTPVDPSEPVVTRPATVVRAFDPWLVATADRFALYFAGEDEDGVGRIYQATGGAPFDSRFPGPVLQVDPATLEGVASVDGPTVWRDGEVERMIVRALTDQGDRVLIALARRPFEGMGSWELVGGRLEAATVHRRGDDLFSFERDEISAPAVVVAPSALGEDVWRLYYGARRGTRWSIGLLVSEDGTSWRSVGAVLEASGAGFDALGVTDPAPVALDGEVRLYYRGWDGARSAIGRAGPAGTMGE